MISSLYLVIFYLLFISYHLVAFQFNIPSLSKLKSKNISKSNLISKFVICTMHFEEASIGNTQLNINSLQRERYIATNRFQVRQNKDAVFEKRWADRQSRISQLKGFQFFVLLKRIVYDNIKYDSEFGNYISLTVWKEKEDFDAWRTGEAFKEAHGGGGITDFMKLVSTALFILKGSPKPAFYDGLKIQSNIDMLRSFMADGWRKILSDGKNCLPVDAFVCQQRLKVTDSETVNFEKAYASTVSNLENQDGFVGRFLQRRDATKADDGFNYIDTIVFRDEPSFKVWKESGSIQSWQDNHESSIAYYEGKLALSSQVGM